MSLEIGIVGLPNVGKSTLFNALTNAHAAVASYPFTTIEPNVGVVPLEDERLTRIAAIIQPETITPSTIRFVDIAGLVQGAHRGEGLGNQFLGHIRNVDAIALVVRCFEDPNIAHVNAQIDPQTDIEIVETELILADLQTVERRLEKVRPAARSRPREAGPELAFLETLQEHLAGGHPARTLNPNEQEQAWLADLHLITAKPCLYVANVGEDDLPDGGPYAQTVLEYAADHHAQAIVLSAILEAELAQWHPEEAAAYRAELGLSRSGLQELTHAGYRLLDLITFFTATGTREVRAWPIPRGTTAPQAAGKVHTDMERGFVRAEVIPWDQFVRAGSWTAAREQGLVRIEGRTYIVQDGDIIHFRFTP